LVSSRAYARSSEWKGKEPGKELFAVAIVRPLTPAQWGLSQRLASEPTAWNATDPAELRLKALDGQEAQAQKIFRGLIEQLRDDFQIGITESLKLSNDAALLKMTGDKLIPILKKQPDHRRRIERLKNLR
jgi:hypothetical protein